MTAVGNIAKSVDGRSLSSPMTSVGIQAKRLWLGTPNLLVRLDIIIICIKKLFLMLHGYQSEIYGNNEIKGEWMLH